MIGNLAGEAQSADMLESFELLDPLIFRLIRRIPLRGLPFWLLSLMVCLVYLFLVYISTTLLGENTRVFWELGVVCSLTVFAELVTLERTLKFASDTLRDNILPFLPAAAQSKVAANLKNLFTPARQAIFCILMALLSVPIFAAPFGWSVGRYTVADAIAVFLVCAATFNLVYYVIILLSNASLFAIRSANLYPLDPRRSPALQGSSKIVSHLLSAVAIVSSVLIIALFLVIQVYAAVPTLVLVITLVAVAGLEFAVQQVQLSQIVTDRRSQTITELQEKLTQLYDRSASLSDEERKQFDYLLTLHDRVSHTTENALNFASAARFIGPMLLPLISFLGTSGRLPSLLSDMLSGFLNGLH